MKQDVPASHLSGILQTSCCRLFHGPCHLDELRIKHVGMARRLLVTRLDILLVQVQMRRG